MKAGFFLTVLFCLLSLVLKAQSSNDQMVTPGQSQVFNEDSLRQVALVQRAQIAEAMAKSNIQYFVIKVSEQQYGYSIFIDGRLYIEQTSIPAIQGESGFPTIDDADKVARLVIEKIKKGELPPAVTIEELTSLGVLH